MNKIVFVGLSGGVDSAVSAMLLKQATPNNFEKLFGRPTPEGFRGFNVVGVFIKIWQPEFIECAWTRDRLDAMRVCVALGIPFREIDLSDEYRRAVVDPMVEGYKQGSTPNPDALCNKSIKFGSFFEYAMKEGADFIATGHYARVIKDGDRHFLARGRDANKDQSYFLYSLNESVISRTIFPVGDMLKNEVRDCAKVASLPVASKPDSQGLCFVGDVTMKDFLSRYIKFQKGDVLDMFGKAIGTHDGASLYTIGQRHGFEISLKNHETPIYYVIKTDMETNTISVSPNVSDCASPKVILNNLHWISGQLSMPFKIEAQTRYREHSVSALIEQVDNLVTATFSAPHASSPGQVLVMYEKEKCLGGGVIRSLVESH